MQRNDRLEGATHVIASLMAAPILLQPVATVTAVLWARHESVLRHPDLAAVNPPTVSRAIVDPAIGDPFANLMLVCFAMLLYSVWRIVAAFYRPTLSHPMKALWLAAAAAEIVAAFGMVVLSQYTGRVSGSMHLIGSYMLFFGHGVGIPLSGIFICIDRNSLDASLAGTGDRPPLAYYPRLHPRLALAVGLCALSFGSLYYGWEHVKSLNNYAARVVFSMNEVVLLVVFESYVASFTGLMFRYESHRLVMRRHAVTMQERALTSAE